MIAAVPRIQRRDIAEAVGRVDAAIVVGDAASEQRSDCCRARYRIAWPRRSRRSGRRRRGPSTCVSIVKILLSPTTGAAASRALRFPACADRHGPGFAQGLAEREMRHGLGGVSAGLRPFRVDDRLRQNDGHRRGRRIDGDIQLGLEDGDAITQHRRLGRALLEDSAAACRQRGERQHQELGSN